MLGGVVLLAAGRPDDGPAAPKNAASAGNHNVARGNDNVAPDNDAADNAARALPPAAVDPPAAGDLRAGRLIRVPLPITGNVDTQVRRSVERAIHELRGAPQRPILVLEFIPRQNQFGEGSNFGRALDLARYLAGPELSGVKTVAFVPRTIRGHGVLVVLACEELVMAPEAELGAAGVDEVGKQVIDPTYRAAYRQIASQRRTVPPEIALGMLDKDLEVLKVETEVSTEYVLRSELDALRAKHNIQSETVSKRPGEFGRFTGREGREAGFVKYLAADRAALAKALSLPPRAVEEDPSLGGSWRPIQVSLKGPINAAQVSRVERIIEDRMRDDDVNFVCLRIHSPGGELSESVTLANFLASLDRGQVRTVAYIAEEALADAAIVAMACDQIVMHKGALLGGPGAEFIGPEEIKLVADTIRENLAKKKERPWSLTVALIDPAMTVYRYTGRDTGLVAYFSEAEAADQPDRDKWIRGEVITENGQPLQLNGAAAEKLGVARHVVKDFGEFKELYALENDVALVEPGWADYLIDALASPAVAWVLLLVGGAAFFVELHAPGVGIGGFVAGVCFLLYFWSRHLDGTAGWLEVLLFMAGICCILLEIFVLPGSGVFGLGGGMLVISSLILASQTFVLPRNEYQMHQLRDSLLGLAAVAAGIVIAAILMRRYLPHTPMLRHMLLEPPSGDELADLSLRESVVDFSHLVGEQGVATTQLTPSGKARFGQSVVDVIASGEVIPRGAQVVVVEAYGNRVVVRPADSPPDQAAT
jgi:membrane-bound ClpP family serine protease